VEGDSRLARALGAPALEVNSLHHQAVDRVGHSLVAVARSPDGIVEGIESTDAGWWVLGVQWHPEELLAGAPAWDRALFRAFAAAVHASRVS
jgi:putative glutamine amidotransferase